MKRKMIIKRKDGVRQRYMVGKHCSKKNYGYLPLSQRLSTEEKEEAKTKRESELTDAEFLTLTVPKKERKQILNIRY